MSLSSLHSIWTTAGSPFEVGKAVVSARMLSGGYRTDKLMSHWNKSNPSGLCRLPGCENEIGTLPHIPLHCPSLIETKRKGLSHWSHWSAFLVSNPILLPIVSHYTLSYDGDNVQFLLDPSVLPPVISLTKTKPYVLQSCFYLSRTWNYSIHLARLRIRKHNNLK